MNYLISFGLMVLGFGAIWILIQELMKIKR